MADKLTAVKGMNDILPGESGHWEWLEAQLRDLMASYAYRNVRTPIVEPTGLFVRGLGGHRYRREGDVLLRGSAQWRATDPSP